MINKGKKRLFTSVAIALVGVIIVTSINKCIWSKADESKDKGLSRKRDTDIVLDSSGDLKITRTDAKNTSMKSEDSWSIFVYMTGSDLESNYENATTDIEEMLNAKGDNENVNIIIQTGGSGKWHTSGIDASKLGRYRVTDGKLEQIETIGLASMGHSDTLYDFLKWGVTNYPAKNMGVVFWNHGSGISKGLCIDTIYNEDSLTLGEVEYAFSRVYNEVLSDQFELIGFDTCLSGALEYANILAPYGRYMVASADVEPGDGWYYTDFIKHIYNNLDANGNEVGKIIVDSYVDFYEYDNKGENVTLATYDLSKVDKVCYEFNKFAKYLSDMYKADRDESKLIDILGSAKIYTYGTMDMGSLVAKLSSSNEYDVASIKKALEQLITYKRIGSGYVDDNCNGITIFAPLAVMSMSDLNICRNALISPYWLNVLEATTYHVMRKEAKIYSKDISYTINEWDNSELFYEDTFEYTKYENPLNKDGAMYKLLKTNEKYTFASKWNNLINDYKDSIKVPQFFHGDQFGMGMEIMRRTISVDIEDRSNIVDVYREFYVKESDDIICLGQQVGADYNKETDTVTAETISQWFALPDGQLLTTYVYEHTDEYTVYGFPVVIDDVESTIRIKEIYIDNANYTYELLGVWDALDDSAYAPRGYLPLRKGAKVTPIYDVYNTINDEYETQYGEEYEIVSDFDFVHVGVENEDSFMGISLDMQVGNNIVVY